MKSIAIIIPCYNEEESIPHLFEQLLILEQKLISLITPTFIFVDDGSKDKTYVLLKQFGPQLKNHLVIQHVVNKNLGGALKTGIVHATQFDYVAFLDSDCTYSPELIIKLVSCLDQGADIATVSPYHPSGKVEGVPAWRLGLSKGLTYLYKVLLGTQIFTYTAMVRAVRQDKLKSIISDRNDFTFVAEMLIKAIKQGYKIEEVPATLSVRKFGTSKMNIVKTILAHCHIINNLIRRRDF